MSFNTLASTCTVSAIMLEPIHLVCQSDFPHGNGNSSNNDTLSFYGALLHFVETVNTSLQSASYQVTREHLWRSLLFDRRPDSQNESDYPASADWGDAYACFDQYAKVWNAQVARLAVNPNGGSLSVTCPFHKLHFGHAHLT